MVLHRHKISKIDILVLISKYFIVIIVIIFKDFGENYI